MSNDTTKSGDNFDMRFAPLAELIRLRSYSRVKEDADGNLSGQRETWDETCKRTVNAIADLGKFTPEERQLVLEQQLNRHGFGAARWLWIGGTDWYAREGSQEGAFNCTGLFLDDIKIFRLMMSLGMKGCGVGMVVEEHVIAKLPAVTCKLDVHITNEPGAYQSHREHTLLIQSPDGSYELLVGDSREGWCSSVQHLLEIATSGDIGEVTVNVDLGYVRPKGTPLKGFGGVANPSELVPMYQRIAQVLNGVVQRGLENGDNGNLQPGQLNSLECVLIADNAANAVVSGNIRRFAGIKQGSADDEFFTTAKDNLWQQDAEGNWFIAPERKALTLSNHTRVYHRKPSLAEIKASVEKQYWSGEGAIEYAPESVARANADLLSTSQRKQEFLDCYNKEPAEAARYLAKLSQFTMSEHELEHRMRRYAANPCHEIQGNNFVCNLASVHLNTLDPQDFEAQADAFKASTLQAAALLQRPLSEPLLQASRELDPIVGVSFTGAFTFFCKLFGVDYIDWWMQGRPDGGLGTYFSHNEQFYLEYWRTVVRDTLADYCVRHSLKRPNRYTTVKPEGSLTLMSGVGSCGIHPPKYWCYIRRMTFEAQNPIALAALDYGYSVSPGSSDTDANGKLIESIYNPDGSYNSDVKTWLVEVPVLEEVVQVLPGAIDFDISKVPFEAQFKWMMQVQNNYATHQVSSTLEYTLEEIPQVADLIYNAIQNDEGYTSAALLAKFDSKQTFPRMPFEPISLVEYHRLLGLVHRRKSADYTDFTSAVDKHTLDAQAVEVLDGACSDGFCSLKS